MTYTDTDICNQALALIGERPITSIDDKDDETALSCKALLPVAVKEVQNTFPWASATTTSKLNMNYGTDDNPNFNMPNNCLRLLSVSNGYGEIDYEVINNKIYAPATEVTVKFIYHNQNASQWSTELAQCIYYTLAIKLAPIAGSDAVSMATNLINLYESRILPNARRLQSMAQNNKRDNTYIKNGSWVRAGRF